MKFEVKQENEKVVTVRIRELGIVAEFEDHDQATKFIQSVINNITRF